MQTTLKKSFLSSLFLKASALLLGFLLWSVLSDSFIASRWVNVPLCFYNSENCTITAPESIQVELRGKRSHLKNLDIKALAWHIDAHTLRKGPQTLTIDAHALSLVAPINVRDTIPTLLTITKEERATNG